MSRFLYTKEELEAIRKFNEYKKNDLEIPKEIKKIVEKANKRYDEECECRY